MLVLSCNTRIVSIYSCSKARTVAKALVARLRDELHRQQYSITIQAAVGGKILGTCSTLIHILKPNFQQLMRLGPRLLAQPGPMRQSFLTFLFLYNIRQIFKTFLVVSSYKKRCFYNIYFPAKLFLKCFSKLIS